MRDDRSPFPLPLSLFQSLDLSTQNPSHPPSLCLSVSVSLCVYCSMKGDPEGWRPITTEGVALLCMVHSEVTAEQPYRLICASNTHRDVRSTVMGSQREGGREGERERTTAVVSIGTIRGMRIIIPSVIIDSASLSLSSDSIRFDVYVWFLFPLSIPTHM